MAVDEFNHIAETFLETKLAADAYRETKNALLRKVRDLDTRFREEWSELLAQELAALSLESGNNAHTTQVATQSTKKMRCAITNLLDKLAVNFIQ
jgi:hypothetical protein